MNRWRSSKCLMATALLAWGCGMADNALFQPKPPEKAKELQAGDESRKLDAELTELLRGTYTIASARYFRVPESYTWVNVSKNVQNQMAEKSIKRVMFEWYEPGLDLVDIYPQNGSGFAVAMNKDAKSGVEKVVGYYALRAAVKK